MVCYEELKSCRVCNSNNLSEIIHLGNQALTGVFPRKGIEVQKAPLQLIKCNGCGLFQLGHNFDLTKMYGDSYGYRSSQNNWMVKHLNSAVKKMSERLKDNDLVIEIGSNDGTSLSFFPETCRKLGIDPSAGPLRELYPKNSDLIVDFFTIELASKIKEKYGKAKVVMSFSMFYDLPDPVSFSKGIANILSEDGVWIFEQSYLISMFETGAFDTICHEHLEYYSLKDINTIVSAADLKIVDVSLNEANGGSFRVSVTHKDNAISTKKSVVALIKKEKEQLEKGIKLKEFLQSIEECKENINELVSSCKKNNKNLYCIGASTKGNVVLQYANLTSKDVKAVGEINFDKIGKECPGTKIPIEFEDDILEDPRGVYLILPWHFKSFFVNSEKFKNKKMVFPLPRWEIVNG